MSGHGHCAPDLEATEFVYRYRGTVLRAKEPEGLTYWNLDSPGAPRVPGAQGQLPAPMLDNELIPRWGLASLRHYRATLDCPPTSEVRSGW
jgi:hypothetical protein